MCTPSSQTRLLKALVFALLFLFHRDAWAIDHIDPRMVGDWTGLSYDGYPDKWAIKANGTGIIDRKYAGYTATYYFNWSTDPANTIFTFEETKYTVTESNGTPQELAFDPNKESWPYTFSGTKNDVWTTGNLTYTKVQTTNYASPYTVEPFVDLGGTSTRVAVNGITCDSGGTLYITLSTSISQITSGGTVSSVSLKNADETPATLSTPTGITVDSGGNLYVADSTTAIISKITPDGIISTYAGISGKKGLTNGPLETALFYSPSQLTLDPFGNLYVIDDYRIRKISKEGVVSTLADGVQIAGLNSIVADSEGTVFFSASNVRAAVMKLDTNGEPTILAGSLSASTTEASVDGTGQAASFVGPLFLAIDSNDNLYVSDKRDLTIRKITSAGVVTTLAGLTKATEGTGSVVDGLGNISRFKKPQALAVNPGGDLLIVDSGYIRKATHPKTSQTITFTPLANRLTTADPFTISATASSGLPVSFSVSGPATLNGNTLTLSGIAGTVKVTASQSGNSIFAAATSIQRSFTVASPPRLPQTITFPQPVAHTYGDAPFQLSATSSADLAVSFAVISGPGTINSSTLTITGAGNITVVASQPGDSKYLPASQGRTILVTKKELTVSTTDTIRAVGQVNPTFPLTYSGFVGTDTLAVIDKVPVASVKATLSSVAGQYPLTLTGGLDNNYKFAPSVTGGSLTLIGYGGSYEAFIVPYDSATDFTSPIGKIELTVSNTGLSYSARLFLANEAAPVLFTGKLTPSADLKSASGVFGRSTRNLPLLDVVFEISTTGAFIGSTVENRESHVLRNGEPFANIIRGQKLYTPAKTSAPWAGNYTVSLPAPTAILPSDSRPLPKGTGYAVVSISPVTGVWTFAGKLADGTTVTTTLNTADSGRALLWTSPYLPRLNSAFAGMLTLEPITGGTGYCVLPTNSYLIWNKAALTNKTLDPAYRDGLAGNLPITMTPWTAPSPATRTTPLVTLAQRLKLASTNLTAGTFALSHGPASIDLGSLKNSLPTDAVLSSSGVVTVTAPATTPANATKWNITITPASGAFAGSFTLSDIVPPAVTPKSRTVKFYGAFTRPSAATSGADFGTGFFLLPGLSTTELESGSIHLSFK
ncbi:MAG: MBG domain-containing protein [Verrucomicrobiota bacterium]